MPERMKPGQMCIIRAWLLVSLCCSAILLQYYDGHVRTWTIVAQSELSLTDISKGFLTLNICGQLCIC